MAKVMTDTEAHTIIVGMRDTAIEDTRILKRRIADYKDDYAEDPSEDTAAQISRIEVRLAKRTNEAIALAIAETKFADNRPTA